MICDNLVTLAIKRMNTFYFVKDGTLKIRLCEASMVKPEWVRLYDNPLNSCGQVLVEVLRCQFCPWAGQCREAGAASVQTAKVATVATVATVAVKAECNHPETL